MEDRMNSTQKTSRPKLEVLDALRGFCALIVIALHFSENYIPRYGLHLIPHGCLPVEYFFILTGFTLVYAYDHRWEQGMTLRSFFKRRLIRLHPLVIIGSIIGAACYLLSAEQYVNLLPRATPYLNLRQLGLLTLWCCTMLPAPSLLGWRLLHPLQGPLWTLFYIYLANILYALVLRHLKTWMLFVLALAAIAFTYHFGLLSSGFHTARVGPAGAEGGTGRRLGRICGTVATWGPWRE
ncbi:MAG: acyltransferase [Kiritimatiellae bacterium]|nr:acyltransferase [Kiritimatiellia bacterium]